MERAAAQVPVAQGSMTGLSGAVKQRVADFVHGTDGFGNLPEPRLPTVSTGLEWKGG